MRSFAGRGRRATASLFAACVLAALASAPAQADGCPFADAQAGAATTQQLSGATVCLLNRERAAAGLAPLAASAPLATTAQEYAEYMVSDAHFAHQDEAGHNVVSRVLSTDPALAGRWLVLGENLGWGTYGMATPRSMVEGWMDSPTHRENILYPRYDEIGVGITPGAPVPGTAGGLTYTTVFGKVAPQRLATARTCMRRARIKARKAHSKRAKARAARAKRACLAKLRAARR